MLPCACFFRAAVREKNVAALTIFRAPSPNAHTNVAALIERHAGQQVTGGLDDRVMPPNLSLRGGRRPTWQSREGSCDFADGFPVVRPCSARLPRRFAPRNDTSGERAVHQCTCAVELPSARCSGNAAAFPIGAISRFLRKKIPEAQASGSFSNTINHNQSQSITINHNQLFTSRRPSSGGRSGAGRPHSPEPSGPRAAACSNR